MVVSQNTSYAKKKKHARQKFHVWKPAANRRKWGASKTPGTGWFKNLLPESTPLDNYDLDTCIAYKKKWKIKFLDLPSKCDGFALGPCPIEFWLKSVLGRGDNPTLWVSFIHLYVLAESCVLTLCLWCQWPHGVSGGACPLRRMQLFTSCLQPSSHSFVFPSALSPSFLLRSPCRSGSRLTE